MPADLPTSGDPLVALGESWRALKGTRLPGLPPLTGGFVGYLAYDVVRHIEVLPQKAVDELGLPELQMLLVTDLAAVDHHECTVVLIANALVHPALSEAELDAAFDDAVARLDAMQDALAAPATSTVGRLSVAAPKDAPSRTPVGRIPAGGRAGPRSGAGGRGVPDPGRAAVLRRRPRPVRSTCTGCCAR